MATAQRPPVTSSATPQYESFVEQQLTKARRRLRGLDLAATGLVLGSGILAYGLTVSLADLLCELPTSVRLTGWCVFVLAALGFLVVSLRRFLWRSVNPHFIARQLEQTVPDAKNSVINWLDLREEPLPPVIRGSLGRRAAKDLTHADAERAISARPLWWLGGIAGMLLLVQLGWLFGAPGQVRSLLQRAFFPFETARIALRTTLTLLKPEGGDIAVATNQPVLFRVEAQGDAPALNQKDSLKLHFRYHQNEPFEERALVQDTDGTWTTTVLADQVRNGFWYKITGGDACLPEDREYRVEVRAIAQVLRYETTFTYRDYLKIKDRTVTFDKNVRPSIKDLRGTELALTVRTNCALQQCVLELKVGGGKTELAGEAVPGDPEGWRFKWVLDQSGEFRILFTSKDGEENVDRQPCKFEVIADQAPEVVLTKPAKDLSLPANGTLVVEGQATDDFGVKSMQLQLQLVKSPTTLPTLRPKAYRPEKSFQLVNGKYPLRLDYSDFVALDALRNANGEPFPLVAGMELEYWLEALDNCDFPDKHGNLGQSARYKLTILPPETNKDDVANERQAAEQQVQKNQKNQDGLIADQNAQAAAQQGGNSGEGGGQSPDRTKLNNDAEKVKQVIDSANAPGNTKEGEQPNGDAKSKGPEDGSAGDSKGTPPDTKDGATTDKDQGNQAKGNEPGAAKGQPQGQDEQPQTSAGEGKDQGQGSAGKDSPGSNKGGDPKADGTDAAKSDSKPGPKDSAGNSKEAPDQDQKSQLGQDKGPGDKGGQKTAQAPPGDVKGATPTDKAAPKGAPTTEEQVAGVKGDPSSQPPSDAKLGPPESAQAGDSKAGDRRGATLDDVNKLRDQLGDASQSDQAKKALEKITDQAADQKVQQAAEKALAENKASPGQAKDAGPQSGQPAAKADSKMQGNPANPTDPGNAAAKAAQAKSDAGKSKEGSVPNKDAGAAKNEPRKPGPGNPGPANQGGIGPDDSANANPVDEAAARRAADLQLESLKKQIDKLRDQFTPEVMNKLNWTEAEREDFLRKMLAEGLLRQQQQKVAGEKPPAPGSINSLLPVTGPRVLQGNQGNNGGPALVESPEAPPGVREAMRIYQGTPQEIKNGAK